MEFQFLPTINNATGLVSFILSFFQIQNQRTSNIAEESVTNDEDVDAENALPDITKLIDPFRTRINISTMKITIRIFI